MGIGSIKSEFPEFIIHESTICVHGISKSHDVILTANRIMKTGLSMSYEGGLNSNCVIFGEIGKFDFNKVFNYSYSYDDNNLCGNIIIAIPKTIQDVNDDSYFIGTFEDIYLGNNKEKINYVCRHPFNAYINANKFITNEFIVGAYIKDKTTGSFVDLILNKNYIGLKSEEDKKIFFEKIIQELIKFGIRSLSEDQFLDEEKFYDQKYLEYIESKVNNKKF